MKNIFKFMMMLAGCLSLCTSCLYSGLDQLTNSSSKEMTAVNYTYRFLYNDTIKKGTPNEEIQFGRVCEVVFSKTTTKMEADGIPCFSTSITHSLNSVQKAGATGSVTKAMLYEKFKKLIATDGLKQLWVYTTISDAAVIIPLDGAPKLGAPGDFSTDRKYRVKAADGSTQDYMIKTVKGF